MLWKMLFFAFKRKYRKLYIARLLYQMKFRFPAAILLLTVAVACHTAKKTTTTEVRTLDGFTVSAKNNPLDIYRESAPRTWDILHTRVALTFDYKERTAGGRAWIDLRPYCCAQDSLVLDAKDMRIDSVCWMEKGKLVPVPFTYENDQLTIRKHTEYNPSLLRGIQDVNRLYVRYAAMPYADTAGGGSAAISEARGLYFINTDQAIRNKPVQIWTQGESESNSHWVPTIDKPNERMTTQLELTIPDSFQTLSNGVLANSKPAGNGLRTDTWKMDMPIQVYAMMFAIGKFSIIKDSWRDKEVSYYVEEEYAPYARQIFQHTPEMIAFFSDITGVPYPWNKYNQVIARDYVSGAMENTTASLFGEFMNQNTRELEDRNNEDIVSHELFHQWFGDYVTHESWSNLTLSESFANYGEQLWRRHYYGDEYADELALEDLNKYLVSTENADPELVRFRYRDREDMFDRISYNKGGAILHYLHGLLGDTLFYRSMNLYLTKNALQSAEATQWRLAVEEASGRDWNWFFSQWYYRGGHPLLDIKYNYDDAAQQLKVTVRQRNSPDSNKLYQLPLKTGILHGSSLSFTDWNLKNRTETFTYPYRNGIRPVILPDYNHWLPGYIVENKKPSQWRLQFGNTHDLINKRRALTYAFASFQDTATKALFMDALQDTMAGAKIRALSLLATVPLQEKMRQQVAYLAVQDRSNRVRAAAMACLGAWKVNSMNEELKTAVKDRSYAVAGAALNALYAVDKATAYSLAKEMLDTDPKAALEDAVWHTLAQSGKDKDLYVFENRVPDVYGTRRVQLADYLSEYMNHVTDEGTYLRGLNRLDELFRAENIPSYRLSILGAGISNISSMGETTPKPSPEVIKERKRKAKILFGEWIDTLPENAIYKEELERAFK